MSADGAKVVAFPWLRSHDEVEALGAAMRRPGTPDDQIWAVIERTVWAHLMRSDCYSREGAKEAAQRIAASAKLFVRGQIRRSPTGTITVPRTGSWTTFKWVGRKRVSLTAGTHVLKIVSDQEYFNLNAIRVR